MAPPHKKFQMPETPEETLLLKLKVISVVTTQRVQHWTIGVEEARADNMHTNIVAAVSDGHRVYKCVLFREPAAQVEEGNSYIFKHYAFPKFGNQSLLSTHTTKFYQCADVVVPPELEDETRRLIRPPSELTPLSLVTVPSEDMTVQATITHLDPVQEVTPPHGRAYPMRSLHLKEDDTEMKAILWREANIAHLEVRMPIILSHMRAKNVVPYGIALHTTSHTTVQLLSGLVDVEVLGVAVSWDEIELLDTKETPRVIPAAVWASATNKPPVTAVGNKLTLCYSEGRVQEVFS